MSGYIDDNPDMKLGGADKRRYCRWCSKTVKTEVKKGNKKLSIDYKSVYKGRKPRKSYHACLSCMVPLCNTSHGHGTMTCFERWHSCRYIPDGDNTSA